MPSFRGERVFRQRGEQRDHLSEDWTSFARRAVRSGGRIVESDTGDYHLVGPSGSHWGTFNAQKQKFQGGTLQRFENSGQVRDVTEDYLG